MVGKRKKTQSRYNKQSLMQQVMEVFAKSPAKTLNYKQIASVLEIKDMGIKRLIVSILYDLVALDQLSEVSTGKYKLKAKMGTIEGIVDMTSRGAAYIVSEEVTEDIFVSPANVNRALHGDKVKIFLFARKKSKQPEGEVVEIIKRKKTSFVGVVQTSKNFAFLIPLGRNMPHDIFIPLSQLNGAVDGDKAIAQMTEWPKKAKNPIGRITDVLGKSGDNDTEMHSILAEFDLPYKFPEHVNEAAEEISDEITKEEIAKRRDFRDITTFTIDPADAKDFDDALSLRES